MRAFVPSSHEPIARLLATAGLDLGVRGRSPCLEGSALMDDQPVVDVPAPPSATRKVRAGCAERALVLLRAMRAKYHDHLAGLAPELDTIEGLLAAARERTPPSSQAGGAGAEPLR